MKNIEIKAKVTSFHFDQIKSLLDSRVCGKKAYLGGGMGDFIYKGLDHSEDVYFNVPSGRLKLRRGDIENCLVGYERLDVAESKKSSYDLAWLEGNGNTLLNVLEEALGIKAIVNKHRHIYLRGSSESTKILLDTVDGLDGHFVEIEIRDDTDQRNEEDMKKECQDWQKLFGITQDCLETHSYSDLLGAKLR